MFSSTVRERKILRSCGTQPIPARARWSALAGCPVTRADALGPAGGGHTGHPHARLGRNLHLGLAQELVAIMQCLGEFVHDVQEITARHALRNLLVDVAALSLPRPP